MKLYIEKSAERKTTTPSACYHLRTIKCNNQNQQTKHSPNCFHLANEFSLVSLYSIETALGANWRVNSEQSQIIPGLFVDEIWPPPPKWLQWNSSRHQRTLRVARVHCNPPLVSRHASQESSRKRIMTIRMWTMISSGDGRCLGAKSENGVRDTGGIYSTGFVWDLGCGVMKADAKSDTRNPLWEMKMLIVNCDREETLDEKSLQDRKRTSAKTDWTEVGEFTFRADGTKNGWINHFLTKQQIYKPLSMSVF